MTGFTARSGRVKEVPQCRLYCGGRALGDELLNALIVREDPDLVCREAVSSALYVRFLKRISAHLMNIASSVVNPFDRIGFRDDDLENPQDDE